MSEHVSEYSERAKNQTPVIVDYSALSYQNQIEELFLRTYLYFIWFPNTPTVAIRPRGVISGVWQQVELKKWKWDGMCYWLAS